MDRQYIDISILFPSLSLIWTSEAISDPGYIRAGAQAYNRWILEFCEAGKNRLVPVAQTALFDMRQAVGDLYELKEAGFAHIMLPIVTPGSPTCFHSDFTEYWAAVQELNFVVHLHKVAIPHQLDIPAGGKLGCKGNGAFFNHVNEILAAPMCLLSLMDNRIPDRFPDIKFAFLECNAGWLPAWLDRTDESYEVLQSKKATLLEAPPRYYIEKTDNFFFGLSLAEDVTRLDAITDRLLIATDFPHPGASIAPVDDWNNRLNALRPGARTNILGGNALRFLDFQLETERRNSLCSTMNSAE
jgi:predicted TIM-barrel fold metal-dependent hydrolase